MRIGVTGHQQRNGADWVWTASNIRRFLSGKVYVRGYSSLAIGADQIFAEQILEAGGCLTSIIPISNYRMFFANEYLTRYDELISRSDVIEINSNKPRKHAFLESGRYIVRNVDTLLAIWDGMPAEGLGGTADVVSYCKSIGKPVFQIDPVKKFCRNI